MSTIDKVARLQTILKGTVAPYVVVYLRAGSASLIRVLAAAAASNGGIDLEISDMLWQNFPATTIFYDQYGRVLLR